MSSDDPPLWLPNWRRRELQAVSSTRERLGKQTVPPDAARQETPTANMNPSRCAECLEVIRDGECGEESLFCEGRCKKWMHRVCAGLTEDEFLSVVAAEADTPWSCARCVEMSVLHDTVTKLAEKILVLEARECECSCMQHSVPADTEQANQADILARVEALETSACNCSGNTRSLDCLQADMGVLKDEVGILKQALVKESSGKGVGGACPLLPNEEGVVLSSHVLTHNVGSPTAVTKQGNPVSSPTPVPCLATMATQDYHCSQECQSQCCSTIGSTNDPIEVSTQPNANTLVRIDNPGVTSSPVSHSITEATQEHLCSQECQCQCPTGSTNSPANDSIRARTKSSELLHIPVVPVQNRF